MSKDTLLVGSGLVAAEKLSEVFTPARLDSMVAEAMASDAGPKAGIESLLNELTRKVLDGRWMRK